MAKTVCNLFAASLTEYCVKRSICYWLKKLRARPYFEIFCYSAVHCILINEELDVRLCVNINQCISPSSALSGSPGLWLINELFSTLSPVLLTTYHQPPPHNTNQALSSPRNQPGLSQRKLETFRWPFLLFSLNIRHNLPSITVSFLGQIEADQFNKLYVIQILGLVTFHGLRCRKSIQWHW